MYSEEAGLSAESTIPVSVLAFSSFEDARFRVRTLEEARDVSAFLAHLCALPEVVTFGLSELMINAVEHGNLGISFEEKSRLCLDGTWQDEVERRLSLAFFASRFVRVAVRRQVEEVIFMIEDQGDGFDWRKYWEIGSEPGDAPNGRGIAIARQLSFTRLEYRGRGNVVVAVAVAAKGD